MNLRHPSTYWPPPDSLKPRPLSVRFSWEQSENAIGYRLELQHKDSGKKFEKSYESCSDANDPITSKIDTEGLHIWTVYALAADKIQEVAANQKWQVVITRGYPPEPLSPANNKTCPRGFIKFRWTKAREVNVKSYNLCIYQEQTDEIYQEIREIDASANIYDVNIPQEGKYAWTVSALCDQDMVLECETKLTFQVIPEIGCWIWIVVLIIVADGGAAGWWFCNQSIEVELRRSDLSHEQASSFELGLSGASQSRRIYLAEAEGQEDAQVLDIGAKGYYIERDFFGLSLCGPEGKIQKVRFGEEFNVPLSDSSDAILTVTKLSKTGPREDEEDEGVIDSDDLLDDLSGADDSNGFNFDDE